MRDTQAANISNLNPVLAAASAGGYAVGAFSPRYTAMIQPVLTAAQALHSPLIVQISQRELNRQGITPQAFADAFYTQVETQAISVPVVLHLDHTKDLATIQAAIAAGFTSVMIDASEQPLEQNIALTREVTAYAQPLGVSVEAELGRIGTTDYVESENDEELFTVPEEAERFVRETGIDALAVSVGTAHGVYMVRQPRVDYARLQAIRALGRKAGVSLNPSTPESVIEYVLDRLDLILLMTVNPGFGGQAFIPSVVEKVRRVKAMIGDRPIHIEIDGGVTVETAPLVAAAGADVLVAGSAVFKGGNTQAYRANIAAIRNAADRAVGQAV